MVNDTYGHDYGDELLVQVSSRLLQHIRKTDTVARIGGDEFIVVLTNINSRNDIEQIAGEVLKSLSSEFVLSDEVVNISGSIGIFSDFEKSQELISDDVIKLADKAMYVAKSIGKNNYVFYDDINTARIHSARFDETIYKAWKKNLFSLNKLAYESLNGESITQLDLTITIENECHNLSEYKSTLYKSPLKDEVFKWYLSEVKSIIQTDTDKHIMFKLDLIDLQGASPLLAIIQRLLTDECYSKRFIVAVDEDIWISLEDTFRNQFTSLDTKSSLMLLNYGKTHASLCHLHKYPFKYIELFSQIPSSLNHDLSEILSRRNINIVQKKDGR